MRILTLIVGVLWLGIWLLKRSAGKPLSAEWHADHERRMNAQGIDGVCWNWPAMKNREVA